jgi:SPP1 family predicted phage head-tail adaptor
MKCCDLTAGKLRHSVAFERETRTADGGGGSTIVWAKITNGDARAFVKPMSGSESVQAQRLEARITHRVFIRYRDDLLTSDRINFGGRLMQIRAIINLEERNRWIEIHAEEGVVT